MTCRTISTTLTLLVGEAWYTEALSAKVGNIWRIANDIGLSSATTSPFGSPECKDPAMAMGRVDLNAYITKDMVLLVCQEDLCECVLIF